MAKTLTLENTKDIPMVEMTKGEVIFCLKEANKKVRKNHTYFCGLVPEEQDLTGYKDDKATFFFESPDGQNGELYYTLRSMGWKHRMYDAEYYWTLYKGGYEINYCEGDVYIRKERKLTDLIKK